MKNILIFFLFTALYLNSSAQQLDSLDKVYFYKSSQELKQASEFMLTGHALSVLAVGSFYLNNNSDVGGLDGAGYVFGALALACYVTAPIKIRKSSMYLEYVGTGVRLNF